MVITSIIYAGYRRNMVEIS